MKPPKYIKKECNNYATPLSNCINEVSVFVTVRRLLRISINYTFYTRQATHFHVLNLSVYLCIPCASPYMSAVAMPLTRDSFNQCTDFYRVRLNEVFLPTLTPDQHSIWQLGYAMPNTFYWIGCVIPAFLYWYRHPMANINLMYVLLFTFLFYLKAGANVCCDCSHI